MKRCWRILLNIFAPPLICSLLLVAAVFSFDRSMHSKPFLDCAEEMGKALVLFLVIAYFIAIIPSALHAFAMEKIYTRFPPYTWKAVAATGASGTSAGFLITAFFAVQKLPHINLLDPGIYMFIGLGLCVGLILGTTIKYFSRTRLPLPP